MERPGQESLTGKYDQVAQEICLRVVEYFRSIKLEQKNGGCNAKTLPFGISLEIRPRGSAFQISSNIPGHVFERNEERGKNILFEEVKKLLTNAERCFKREELIIKISTRKGDPIVRIIRKFGVEIAKVIQPKIQKIEPPAVKKEVESPVVEKKMEISEVKKIIKDPKPKPTTAKKEKENPKPVKPEAQKITVTIPVNEEPKKEKSPPKLKKRTQQVEPLDRTHDPSQPIDYESMKYFNTDASHRFIRKTFKELGVKTGEDILKLLETNEPTRVDWEIFVKNLKKAATQIGAGFGPSADGTLYWWLTKVMKWVKPFPKN